MISINVVNPIAFNYVLIHTGYTHRIQTIGRDTFQEEIENGVSFVLTVSDNNIVNVFDKGESSIYDETIARAINEHTSLAGFSLIRLDSDRFRDWPLGVLRSYEYIFSSNYGEHKYCSCFYGIPDDIYTIIADNKRIMVLMFDCESG